MARRNRQWVVAARPQGKPRPSDFEYRELPVASPGEGEALLQTLYLSVAPVMAMYMSGAAIAERPPLAIGDVIHGRGVARVVESRHPDLRPGDILHGQLGWQTWVCSRLVPAERFYRFAATDLPAHLALGALGMTGFSAWCGLVEVGEPRPGRPVLVSGAAGGVGHLVVQIARCLGASPVIGIAGGPDKCRFLEELGCDHALDYRQGDLRPAYAELFPEGIDLYFDNVGGELLEMALDHLGPRARIVLCGSISEYTREEPFGPRNYTRLRRHDASMRGFFVYNHERSFPQAEAQMADWIRRGEIRPVQQILRGFERLPEALIGLYEGRNTGKLIVDVAAEEEIA